MRRGILFAISGPSGCGKGTVVAEVRKMDPSIGYSVSCTTRAPRPGEEEGVHYFFVTHEQFDEMVATGEIVEWDEFCGNKYGTPKTPLVKAVEEGRDIMLDITIPGTMKLKELLPEDTITVFLMPPSEEELERRLRKRETETEEQILARLAASINEMKQADRFEYTVVNAGLEECADEIYKILEERRKNA